MDITKDRKFLVYLGIGVTLGLAYLGIEYLSNRKTSNAKPISLEKTRKILQQIKFQILTTCTTFVQGLKNKPKTNHSQQDLEIFYRSELAKVYDMREDTILSKYVVTRDEYAASLNHYKKDAIIQQGQKEIIQILQNATKNLFPDYSVHREAQNLIRQEQVVEVYLEMCELISIKVWQKLDQEKQKNPGFNSKDDTHFKKAIREISIYDIKAQFLQKKGFQPEWGCPNEVFYKVMESLKQANKQIKNRATVIEKAYEKIIQRITNQPHHLNAERIKFLFDQFINNKVPEVKHAPQPQPKPQAPLLSPVQNVPKKVVAPVKKDQDFNMDELMMQQLMSRSQEEPKQVVKAEFADKIEQKQYQKQQSRVQAQQKARVQAKDSQVQIEQKADLQMLRQKAVQRQEAAVHQLKPPQNQIQVVQNQLQANQQQDQLPQLKIEEAIQVMQAEIIAHEKIEELRVEPQTQVFPEPPKIEENVQIPQVQNSQIKNVREIQVKVEEVEVRHVDELKEQEKAEKVVEQQEAIQDANAEKPNELLPEQQNEAGEE